MTKKQNWLYWREWQAVVRQAKKNNLPAPDRHDLHAAALGADKSHLKFNNGDLDKVLAVFRAHSRPDDVAAQLRQIEQPATRLRHRLREFDSAYLSKIARDKFGTDDLDLLNEEQLTQLRNTLCARESGWKDVPPPIEHSSAEEEARWKQEMSKESTSLAREEFEMMENADPY